MVLAVLEKIFKHISLVFIDKVIRLLVPLVSSIVISRLMGVDAFGYYSYINTLYSIFLGISLFGLDSILVKVLIEESREKSAIAYNAFILKLVWSFGVAITFLLTTIYLDVYSIGVVFLAISIPVLAWNIPEYVFQSELRFREILLTSIAVYPICLIFKCIIIYKTGDLNAKFFMDLLESVFFVVILHYFSGRTVVNIGEVDFNKIKKLASSSFPLMVNTLIVILYFKVDQLILGKMLGFNALGGYSAAVQISSILGTFPSLIMSAIFPYIIKWYVVENDLVKIKCLYRAFIYFFVFLVTPLFFLSDLIFSMLYGHQFSSAALIFKIHVFGFLFVYIGAISGSIIIAKDLVWFSTVRSIASLLISIVLNFSLIPQFGIIGAAISFVISQFFANYIFYLLTSELREIFLLVNKAVLAIPMDMYNDFKKVYSLLKRR